MHHNLVCGSLLAHSTQGNHECPKCSDVLEKRLKKMILEAPKMVEAFTYPRWHPASAASWENGDLVAEPTGVVPFKATSKHLHLADTSGNKQSVLKSLVRVAKQVEPLYYEMIRVRDFTYLSKSETARSANAAEADTSGLDLTPVNSPDIAAIKQFRLRMDLGLPGPISPQYRAGVGYVAVSLKNIPAHCNVISV